MNAFISYFTAAAYWNVPYIETVLGYRIDETSTVDFTVSKLAARSRTDGMIDLLCEI